jgi:hypothetical protein
VKRPNPRKKPRKGRRRKAVTTTAPDSIWGILPDQIRSADLANVNLGLEFLFGELREAAERHKKGDNGGRSGTIQAVEAVTLFLHMFSSTHTEKLDVPLALLVNALSALDRNAIQSVVKPVRRSGRPHASGVRQALKGVVAYTIRRLKDVGMDERSAQQAVVPRLKAFGIKPDRGSHDLTARTVRDWCEATVAGAAGVAATWMVTSLLANPKDRIWEGLPKEDAIQGLLDYMAELIGPLRAFDLT